MLSTVFRRDSLTRRLTRLISLPCLVPVCRAYLFALTNLCSVFSCALLLLLLQKSRFIYIDPIFPSPLLLLAAYTSSLWKHRYLGNRRTHHNKGILGETNRTNAALARRFFPRNRGRRVTSRLLLTGWHTAVETLGSWGFVFSSFTEGFRKYALASHDKDGCEHLDPRSSRIKVAELVHTGLLHTGGDTDRDFVWWKWKILNGKSQSQFRCNTTLVTLAFYFCKKYVILSPRSFMN